MSEYISNSSNTQWEHLYFYGLTKFPVDDVGLQQNMVQSLIAMIGIKASICTGALIEPKNMLNKKGLTPWLAMYLLILTQNPDFLAGIFKGTALAFVPNNLVEQFFVNENNWPKELLAQYNIEIDGYNVFLLSFLVPKGTDYNLNFEQSMKAPDGTLEIFGVSKFDEIRPELLLFNIQDTLQF